MKRGPLSGAAIMAAIDAISLYRDIGASYTASLLDGALGGTSTRFRDEQAEARRQAVKAIDEAVAAVRLEIGL